LPACPGCPAYGAGGKGPALLSMVRSDLSQRVVVEPATPLSGANVADHEMIVLDVR
jgi:hypothetical protein